MSQENVFTCKDTYAQKERKKKFEKKDGLV